MNIYILLKNVYYVMYYVNFTLHHAFNFKICDEHFSFECFANNYGFII